MAGFNLRFPFTPCGPGNPFSRGQCLWASSSLGFVFMQIAVLGFGILIFQDCDCWDIRFGGFGSFNTQECISGNCNMSPFTLSSSTWTQTPQSRCGQWSPQSVDGPTEECIFKFCFTKFSFKFKFHHMAAADVFMMQSCVQWPPRLPGGFWH